MRGKKEKESVVNDKLIGGICGTQGLVLMWRPDGAGIVCQLIRLCPPPGAGLAPWRGKTGSSEYLNDVIVPAPVWLSLFLLTEMAVGLYLYVY